MLQQHSGNAHVYKLVKKKKKNTTNKRVNWINGFRITLASLTDDGQCRERDVQFLNT